jgi:hypothetical protein
MDSMPRVAAFKALCIVQVGGFVFSCLLFSTKSLHVSYLDVIFGLSTLKFYCMIASFHSIVSDYQCFMYFVNIADIVHVNFSKCHCICS